MKPSSPDGPNLKLGPAKPPKQSPVRDEWTLKNIKHDKKVFNRHWSDGGDETSFAENSWKSHRVPLKERLKAAEMAARLRREADRDQADREQAQLERKIALTRLKREKEKAEREEARTKEDNRLKRERMALEKERFELEKQRFKMDKRFQKTIMSGNTTQDELLNKHIQSLNRGKTQ